MNDNLLTFGWATDGEGLLTFGWSSLGESETPVVVPLPEVLTVTLNDAPLAVALVDAAWTVTLD